MCVNKQTYAKVLQTERNEKKNGVFIFIAEVQCTLFKGTTNRAQ